MRKFLILGLFLVSSTIVFSQAMNGHYTIDDQSPKSATNFHKFEDAIDSLVSKTVNGNVMFSISAGEYDVSKDIPFITKQNVTDTIFFYSTSGLIDVTFNSKASSQLDNYILFMDGANALSFDGINFKSDDSTYGGLIKLGNGTEGLVFNNCSFECVEINSPSADMYMVYSNNLPEISDIHFYKNMFIGGSQALHFDLGFNKKSRSVFVGECVFEKSLYAIVISYVKGLFLYNNKIDNVNNGGGISLLHADSIVKIIGNHVITGGSGVSIYNHDSNGGLLEVENNVIISDTARAFGLHSSDSSIVVHNTFYNLSNSIQVATLATVSTSIVKNNIFYNDSNATPLNFTNNAPTLELSNNCYYSRSSAVMIDTGATNGVTDISNWYAASGYGLSAVISNPNFLDSIHLKLSCGTSELLKSTIAIPGSFYDKDGDSRDLVNPWMGADEYRVENGESFNLSGYVHDGTDTLKHGKVIMVANKNNNRVVLDTIAVTSISDGHYSFMGIEGYTYRLIIDPDVLLAPNFIKSYSNNVSEWVDGEEFTADSCNYIYDLTPLKLLEIEKGTNKITGRVVSGEVGKTTNPIPGLDVVLDKIPPAQAVAKTITDENGYYTFDSLPADTFKVIIDYPGLGADTLYTVEFTEVGQVVNNLNYCVDTATAIGTCAEVDNVKEELSFNPIKIYPNPTTGVVNVSNGDFKINRVEVFSLEGKQILSLITNTKNAQFDIAQFDKGIYIVKAYSYQVSFTNWVVKK